MSSIQGIYDFTHQIHQRHIINLVQDNILNMNHKKFYREVGKLLYAIANADGMIREKEISAVRDIVKEEFVPFEKQYDEFGVNDAWYAEYEFEVLDGNFADVETAFSDFIWYVRTHEGEISDDLKRACLNAAERVAEVFRGDNHFEEFYLNKLRKELKVPVM